MRDPSVRPSNLGLSRTAVSDFRSTYVLRNPECGLYSRTYGLSTLPVVIYCTKSTCTQSREVCRQTNNVVHSALTVVYADIAWVVSVGSRGLETYALPF